MRRAWLGRDRRRTGAARRDGGRLLACALLRQSRGLAWPPPQPGFRPSALRGRSATPEGCCRGRRAGSSPGAQVARATDGGEEAGALGLRRRGSRTEPPESVWRELVECGGEGRLAAARFARPSAGWRPVGHGPAAPGLGNRRVTKPARRKVRSRREVFSVRLPFPPTCRLSVLKW